MEEMRLPESGYTLCLNPKGLVLASPGGLEGVSQRGETVTGPIELQRTFRTHHPIG